MAELSIIAMRGHPISSRGQAPTKSRVSFGAKALSFNIRATELLFVGQNEAKSIPLVISKDEESGSVYLVVDERGYSCGRSKTGPNMGSFNSTIISSLYAEMLRKELNCTSAHLEATDDPKRFLLKPIPKQLDAEEE